MPLKTLGPIGPRAVGERVWSKSSSPLHNEGSLRGVELNSRYCVCFYFILLALELSILYISRNIRSIDISDVAIRQMSEQNKSRPELIFEKMDVMNMDYKVPYWTFVSSATSNQRGFEDMKVL